ncbi:MAG: HDOD domain-containing protein [Gammaproteobacteria bacterium]|nr:HDOD domain-containing protein [Gammaproteobacteria bacterium]
MDLKSLAQNTRTLFSLPDVVTCINQLIDDPNAQTTDLAEAILCDAGLAARLLRLANSAYYNPRRRVETIAHAIILLGHRQLRDLVMTTVAVSIFKGLPPELVNMDRFWLHSIRCGSAARRLAQYRQFHETEHFFIAGLLHGVGKLVLYSQYPERYREVLELAGENELARIAAERRVFKFTYAEVGAELLKSWRLYDHLHMAVAYHLEPSRAPSTYRLEATILHVAVQIANSMPAEADALSDAPPDHTPANFASLAKLLNLKLEFLASLPTEIDLQAREVFEIVRPVPMASFSPYSS